MKKYLLLIVCIINTQIIFAQMNLVRNPSLEDYAPHCPVTFDQIKLATGWSCIDTLSNHIGGTTDSFGCNFNCTPEYYNVCNNSFVLSGPHYDGVPSNWAGYQYPRTGNGYASVWMYCDSVAAPALYNRDYLMGRLYHPLSAGRSYCVTFYANKANGACFSVNHIGAYLDDGSIDTNNYCGLPLVQYTPQVEELEIIKDTVGWTKISGSFIANGTEKYITIGNFASRLNTDTVWLFFNAGWVFGGAYYEIDDVSVIGSDEVAYAGTDTTIHAGDSVYVGLDSNGEGMPCYWYRLDSMAGPIDSGGRIQVKPAATTTYIVQMNLCGTITADTVVITVLRVNTPLVEQLPYVHLYPNPANSVLYALSPPGCWVTITDICGTKKHTEEITSPKQEINISGLQPGTYLITFTDPATGARAVRRFVKE